MKAKESYCSDYKKFSSSLFRADLALSWDHANKDYDSLMKTLSKYAPVKKKFVRANEIP